MKAGYNSGMSRKTKGNPAVVHEIESAKPNLWPLIILATGAVVLFLSFFDSSDQQSTQPSIDAVPTIAITSTPTIDPNPVIDCEYPIECGGTQKAIRSICINTTCCTVADKSFITSPEQCDEAAKKYNDALDRYNENTQKIMQDYNEKLDKIEAKRDCEQKVQSNYQLNIASGMDRATAQAIKGQGELTCQISF